MKYMLKIATTKKYLHVHSYGYVMKEIYSQVCGSEFDSIVQQTSVFYHKLCELNFIDGKCKEACHVHVTL